MRQTSRPPCSSAAAPSPETPRDAEPPDDLIRANDPLLAYRVYLHGGLHELDDTTPAVRHAANANPSALVELMVAVAEQLVRATPELGIPTVARMAAHIEASPAHLQWLQAAVAAAGAVTIAANAEGRRSYAEQRNLISTSKHLEFAYSVEGDDDTTLRITSRFSGGGVIAAFRRPAGPDIPPGALRDAEAYGFRTIICSGGEREERLDFALPVASAALALRHRRWNLRSLGRTMRQIAEAEPSVTQAAIDKFFERNPMPKGWQPCGDSCACRNGG